MSNIINYNNFKFSYDKYKFIEFCYGTTIILYSNIVVITHPIFPKDLKIDNLYISSKDENNYKIIPNVIQLPLSLNNEEIKIFIKSQANKILSEENRIFNLLINESNRAQMNNITSEMLDEFFFEYETDLIITISKN